MSAQKAPRELKVEDALLYLDQVKMEFSDKPAVYNEFLDIMKNFKAQSINTPGVIERVKNLFKGYNKLILGFNTFLPEGEGYKIELTPEEQAADQANSAAAATAAAAAAAVPAAVPAAPIATQVPAVPKQAGMQQQPQHMQQQHAIHYVTKIRNRFQSEPDTYRQFLKILHTYQKEQKGIKEVLEQVSTLFADHPDLLMEFTYFLPDAVQDQAKERLHRAARESEARRHAKLLAARNNKTQQQQQQQQQPGVRGPMGMGYNNTFNGTQLNRPGVGLPLPAGYYHPNQQLHLAETMRGQALNHFDATFHAQKPTNRAMMEMMTGTAGGDVLNQQITADGPAGKKRMRPSEKAAALNAAAGAGGPSGKVARKNAANAAAAGLSQEGMDEDDFQNLSRKQQMQLQMEQQQQEGGGAGGRGPGRGGAAGKVGRKKGGDGVSAQAMLSNYQQQHHARARDGYHSMSAERKFFDTVKEVLISTNRDHWVEFVKCLELFSNDSISRDELIDLVGDLLLQASGNGVAGNELILEFKRLLSNREDYNVNKEDIWFAVPLSEIDFSQCRKCTPSYRALPRDYPKPKCSERNEEEAKVINDAWVSIPIGSEESYSFKHMRKNQYEEALFKVEDERFEIDMIIDSNMNTIRVLEPLAEEIAQFKTMEERGTAAADGTTATHAHLTPRFTFQLDKRHLSTVNLNAISRIYGEAHGEEILELLRKNPVAAIPVILKRLRQKDIEWRAARVELNNNWKEVVTKNHFKSFDHRSFYFRQHDKKYLSTRQLVNEIVGSAPVAVPSPVNGLAVSPAELASATSNNGGDASGASVGDGSVNGATSLNGTAVSVSVPPMPAAVVASQLSSEDAAISGLGSVVEEGNKDLLAGMSPQQLLNYSNSDHMVHRDIYRIMCHAAESTLSNTADKERLAALWRDLLRVFFNVPPHYLYSQLPPTVPGRGSSDPALAVPKVILHPSEAWLPETRVITLYGSGIIKAFRASDCMYEVQLAFGKAYLSPTVIYGAEQLSSHALAAIGVSTDPATGKDTIYEGRVSSTTTTSAATAASAASGGASNVAADATVKDPSKLFYGTQMCYIFLRLHHTLYVRLSIAHQLAKEASALYLEQQREAALYQATPSVSPRPSAANNNKNVGANAGTNNNTNNIKKTDPLTIHATQSGRFTAAYNHTNLLSFMDAYDDEAAVIHNAYAGASTAYPHSSATDRARPIYGHFFTHLLSLVEGSMDSTRFEDQCRSLLGNKAYILYTLDKIITQGIKHLQAMANDENVNKLVGLFVYHHHNALPVTTANGSNSGGAVRGGVDPVLYQSHVAHILSHTMEDVYRIQLMTSHSGVKYGVSQVGVQHLGILNPNNIGGATTAATAGSQNTSTVDLSAAAAAAAVTVAGTAADAVVANAATSADGSGGIIPTGRMSRANSSSITSTTATLAATTTGSGGGVLTGSPRAMSIVDPDSGLKAPKAVVSDGEEDDDDEDDEENAAGDVGTNDDGADEMKVEDDGEGDDDDDEDDDEDVPPPPKQLLYSPRSRQFMS